MILIRRDQFFNMFNTNGRRKDIIESYKVYLEILKDLEENGLTVFSSFPKSMTQFFFYQESIKRSSHVFKIHSKYDLFIDNLEGDYKKFFFALDKEKFIKLPKGIELLDILDVDIEARARHYTSNLVKMGFTDNKRKITEVGHTFINGLGIIRDEFEQLLPISDSNLLFLRQLMKLRIYNKEKTQYYSPMAFAIYILLENDRVSVNHFKQLIQLATPYKPLNEEELEKYMYEILSEEKRFDLFYYQLDTHNNKKIIGDKELNKCEFKKKFNNKKSKLIVDIYYEFYLLLRNYKQLETNEKALRLIEFYKNNKVNIDSAFGYGISLFNTSGVKNISEFKDKNKDNNLINCNISEFNEILYKEFEKTKKYILLMEYADTLMRLLGVSGIVQVKNGIVSLKNTEVWRLVDKFVNFKTLVFGSSTEEEYQGYEGGLESLFSRNISMVGIYKITESKTKMLVDEIKNYLGCISIEEVQKELKDKLNEEFIRFINEEYPVNKIYDLLNLFGDRSNDNEIKKITKSEASISTIFEYVCGIALYHISIEKYNVFDSFNLTMNADFVPETHALGGDGDIIARYKEKTIMLEVTLMNKQAQKRGEWEPVLRHSVNLVIEEIPKPVYTLFIADEFDDNSINIWRAVASVPLKSSREVSTDGLVAENVKILPVTGNELSKLLNKGVDEEIICKFMNFTFKPLVENFDLQWRDKVLDSLLEEN